MLKFLFALLLLANGLLWAYGEGYLGQLDGQLRQPQRMAQQLNADRLKLIAKPGAMASEADADTAMPAQASAASEAVAAASVANPAPTESLAPPAAASAAAPPLACIEIGDFSSPEAAHFASRLAPLALPQTPSRIAIAGPASTGYIVYIPAQGGKEGATRKVAQLQRLGVKNYFIMADSATLRWSVSLGVFKSETAAQNLLADMLKLGIRNARIAPRVSTSKLLAFQLRRIDPDTKLRLAQISADFPAQRMRACQ
jgi:cell division septation protein DedD